MKKKAALILLLLVGLMGYSQGAIVNAQTLDCSKLKTIKAYNPDYPKKTFVIKGATQESYDNGVLQMVWSVKWVTDCQYEVTCTKKNGENHLEVGDRIVTDIMSIDGDCFTVKRTFYCKNLPQGDVDPESTFCIAK